MSRAFIILPLFFLSSCLPNLAHRKNRPAGASVERGTQKSLIRKKISLLPFYNEASIGGAKLGVVAMEEIKRELERGKEFVITLKSKNTAGLSSKQIYSSGGGYLSSLAWGDKLAGIHFILYGRVVNAEWKEDFDSAGVFRKKKLEASARVEIRVFDVNSNRNVFSQVFKGVASRSGYKFYKNNKKQDSFSHRDKLLRKAIQAAVRRGVPRITLSSHKVHWTGRIAKIIGPKIYISAGKKSGVKIGDVMSVVTEGAEIYDPETGALIGVSRGDVKATLEVIDYFGEDGSVSVLHSGGAVVEGDFVQLYQ